MTDKIKKKTKYLNDIAALRKERGELYLKLRLLDDKIDNLKPEQTMLNRIMNNYIIIDDADGCKNYVYVYDWSITGCAVFLLCKGFTYDDGRLSFVGNMSVSWTQLDAESNDITVITEEEFNEALNDACNKEKQFILNEINYVGSKKQI